MGLPIEYDEAFPLSINVQLLHSMSWDVQIVRCYPRGRRSIEAQQTVFGSNKHAQQVAENLLELVKIKGGEV
jgi:hypothetical protein